MSSGRRRRSQFGAAPVHVITHPTRGPLDFDPSEHGVLLAMGAVGALVTIHRMARHHDEGKYALETVEGVVTGMVLYSVLEAVRDRARPSRVVVVKRRRGDR
jgi:hypothetical protein